MLIDTVRETIGKHGLIRPGDHIVLGLSGGPDSVCLFDILRRLAPEYDLHLFPVHVNHMLRPGEAERDQKYAEELCASAGLTCRSFVIDCAEMARRLGMTSEEAGRKARYDAFLQTAREIAADSEIGAAVNAFAGSEIGTDTNALVGSGIGTDAKASANITAEAPGEGLQVRIAVAQNANDQAETILHRILRGTGTDGLSGIAYQRYERGIPVIRPLLDVPRKDIECYCAERDLRPVIDHTNLQPVYTRNRIRLELLPEMEKINPNIVEGLTRLGRIAAADRDYLWEQAERALEEVRIREEAPEGEGSPAAAAAEGAVPGGTSQNVPGGASQSSASQIVLDRARLAGLAEALRLRVILKCFAGIGLDADISEERLRAADQIIAKKQAPKTVQFPRGYTLTVQNGRVYFRR